MNTHTTETASEPTTEKETPTSAKPPDPGNGDPVNTSAKSAKSGNFAIAALKQLRRQIMHKSWHEPVKPIAWHNLHWWIYKTIATDAKHYQVKQRPFSFDRLWHQLSPNLSQPIFIIGAPRSGTTFLGACIGELPEISYSFEPVMTKAATRYVYEQRWSRSQAGFFYKTVYGWLMRLHWDGDLRFAEKTPRSAFMVKFLHEIFPDARFIHILRDGRDAALSLTEKPWYSNAYKGSIMREPGGYRCGPGVRFWVEPDRQAEFETTNDLHRCIWLWRRYTEAILTDVPSLPSNQYCEIKYEDLVAQPEAIATQLLDFMAIDNSDSRQIFQQAIAKVRPDSVGRWQKQLNAQQLLEIEAEAGALLHQLGYG
jgi:hypothetical protein